MPEFGSWMIEATPSRPYGGTTADLNQVEFSMAARRFRINRTLPSDVFLFSMVNFPLLGAGAAFTTPSCPIGGPSSRSAYISDACISPHPRFSTLVSSIRRRRGRKVNIQIPQGAAGKFIALYGAEEIFDNLPDNIVSMVIENRVANTTIKIPPSISRFQSLETLMLDNIIDSLPD
jgi:hypothetical protein